ncbi:MAG: LLM class F420-dependent oxidoreductase [Deltaproteobacteria bacterium]|nr:LLM class F420-dependent oxidoreductase [Deltaproteobacteria bacterium]
MKIGVSMFLTEKTGNAGAIAREAENLGFESFWVAEHLVMPVTYATWYPRGKDGKVPEFYASLIDPFIALATAAAATTTIKLGTGICLLPERNVIETAKAVASLDLYSGGRFIFGVGAGWFPEEATIMGVDFNRRWLHLRESVEALRELWTKDEASYNGEIIKFPSVKLYPKPVQKPGPPIILGAHDPKHALRRVARYADGWCPGGLTPEKAREYIPQIRTMAREFGRDPDKLEFSVLQMAVTTEGPSAEALAQYRDAGVTRIVVLPAASADSDGIKLVRELAPLVTRAAKL